MSYKTTEAHRKASRAYRQRNKEQEKLNSYRRTAKMYINKHATLMDLIDLETLLINRFEELLAEETTSRQENYRELLKERRSSYLEKEE